MSGALTRYRVMSWIVGVALAVIVLVGIPLQIAGHEGVVYWLGFIHGWGLYPVYLIFAIDLFRRAWFSREVHLGVKHLVVMVCAGFVPVLAFVAERWVTGVIRGQSGDRVA